MGSPKRKSSPEVHPRGSNWEHEPADDDDDDEPAVRRVDNWLALVVLLLSLGSMGLLAGCERVLAQDNALGDSDEQRLAVAIAEIEAEITRSYSARQIDASADGADGAAAAGTSAQADPTTPNADGEFEVPTAGALKGHEALLASKLLVPVADESWCEVRVLMRRTLPPDRPYICLRARLLTRRLRALPVLTQLRLASSVPAGAYALSVSGVIGRLGAHASGGCLLLQVHFNGAWQTLLGSPRRRTERIEAPLEHRFLVPHPFDGVRLLATTYGAASEAGGRLALTHLGRDVAPPKPPAQKRSRYLVFELDRGFGASHLGLFNGIALAYLLNVTAVLPTFHTYAHRSYPWRHHTLRTATTEVTPHSPACSPRPPTRHTLWPL